MYKNQFHKLFTYISRLLTVSSCIVPSGCSILLKWDIPELYYVDPYQIHNLLQKNAARLTASVNTEQMAHQTQHMSLYTLQKAVTNFRESIPIHLRYSSPSSEHYLNAFALPPSLFYSCTCGNHCKLDETDELSDWTPLGDPTVLNNELSIPVGNLYHSCLVTIVTLLICFTSTLYIAVGKEFH